MAFQYLEKDTFFEAYKASQNYMRPLFEPFDEFERIARNQPHPDLPREYPKVTDGTTSSIIQKTPRRIIQQLPTGVVTSDTNDWLSIVANFILNKRIIPNANSQFALLQKDWNVVKKGLTFGSQAGLVQFVNRGDYFGPDLIVPYVKDVLYEPGKVSDLDSNFMFVRAWYQPGDIKAIIEKEKQLKRSAKERGEVYDSSWDLSALEKIKDEVSQKPEDQQSQAEKDRQGEGHKGGVEIIHAFQTGVGAVFYSFSAKSGDCVRKKVNKDPRGIIPLHTFYADIDGANPLGWGLAEQLGPMQNLMDSEMQMYQYNRALMLNPPLIKKGNWSKSQAKFRPNQIIDLGMGENSSLEALQIDSTAIANFPNNYGLMKSQILNLAASPDTSTSASVGNPGFSKTDAGVDALMANMSVDDNFIRKQFETWDERVKETFVNLYFAERTGIEELQVDDETAEKLRKIDPELVNQENKVQLDYDTATEALKFEVDASSSNMKNDSKQLESLDGLVERYQNSPILQQFVPPKKVISAWNSIVAASGVENPEDLQVTDEELTEIEQQQAAAEQMAQEQAMQAQVQSEVPQEGLMPSGIPTGAGDPIEAEKASIMQELQALDQEEASQVDPGELAFVQGLLDLGYGEDKVDQAMAMLEADMSEDEILELLGPAGVVNV